MGKNTLGWLFEKNIINVDSISTSDTLHNVFGNISSHFIQSKKISVLPIEYNTDGYTEMFVLFFLGTLFLLALVWYFFPERLLKIIYNEDSKVVKRMSGNQFNKPDIFLTSLLFLIFLSSTTSVIYFIIKDFFGNEFFNDISIPKVFSGIELGIIFYLLIRVLIIFFSGLFFNTMKISKKLLTSLIKIDIIQGIVLIPIIFFIYFSSHWFFNYAGILVITLIIIYKWYRIFFIGLSLSNVTVFHNILYLCILEIIPVYILIKLYDFYQLTA